jgi:DHA1 family tetracycline resistance protein-like MFS transporter
MRLSSPTSRPALAFIFVTVLLDMLALGMIIPVLPPLIEDFRGGDTAAAARTLGLFGTAWALMQFVASPVLGSLADRFGRRPIVLASNLGLGADYVLMALAPTLGLLFVGRVISGITSASVPTAFAYVADVTPPERRARSFGLLGAAFGIGFIVGPAIGGVLGQFGPRLPFWVAGAFSLANALYGFFILPESLPLERRSPFSWRRANPMGALRLLSGEHALAGFACVHFLFYLAHQALQSVFVLYVGYRYGWDSAAVGWALAVVGASVALVQGVLVGRVVAAIGERRALLTGLAMGATGFFIYGVAPVGWMFAAGMPIMALWGLYGPSAQGLMTRRVSPAQQGQLQGALNSVMGLTGIVGPGIFSVTFAWSISRRDWHLPGAPYLLASLMLMGAVALAWRVTGGRAAGAR